jgi:hypothetical protein
MSQSYDFSTVETQPETPLINHAKPKHQVTFFCRLCRKSGLKTPKAHLRDYHGADYRATQNKAYKDIIEVLFVENY